MISVLPAEAVQKMAASNPQFAAKLQQLEMLKQKSEAYRGALAELANGGVPGNLPMLLKDAESSATQGASFNAPPPAGGGGGADPVVQRAVQLLQSGQGTPAQLQEAVKAGKITQQQYNLIIQNAQAGRKK
jgi:DICT domain-containing protein